MDDLKTPPASTGASGRAADDPAAAAGTRAESSVKETIESILIAFILAFIFRAFVVEAFVIPTGSMATTLMGAHMRFRCPDCGYRFEVNYSAHQGQGEDLTIPSRAGPILIKDMSSGRTEWRDKTYDVRCPNCAFQLPPGDLYGQESNAKNPPVNYGDRILVLKYLYLLQEPRRWDVVVFKSPADPAYQQNYIKRLIGKPGESVVILDGDIYVGKGDDASKYSIQTKPRYVQEALWRNIYDNDHFPLGLKGRREPWQQPWKVSEGSGWKGLAGESTPTDVETTHQQQRVFDFDSLSGGSSVRFEANANPTQAFTDYLVYDSEGPTSVPNVVGDLKLSFFYERKVGDGPLRLLMSKGEDTFVAELTPGHAKLIRQPRDGKAEPVLMGESEISKSNGPLEVEFTNHDYRVALRLGGKDVIVTTREQYHPNVARLLADYAAARMPAAPTVEIACERQQSAISHLNLSRDIYYINRGSREDGRMAFAGTPRNIMHLGKDEYFVMGDNALISGDARYWSKPIELPYEDLRVEPGRVPGRFMLGKAFFVYWPAGFRPFPQAPPLAPDFGDMRFIR